MDGYQTEPTKRGWATEAKIIDFPLLAHFRFSILIMIERTICMYYFDNSATTLPLPEVLEVWQKVSQDYFANPSSAHLLGEKSQKLLISARQQIGDLIRFDTSDVHFTSSGTESNNWVFQAILPDLKAIHPQRNRILISAIEHPATLKQVPMLQEQGYQVDLIPVDSHGQVDLEVLASLLSEDILLLSTMAVNNEVGAIQPLKEISELLSEYPQIIWHVDAVQAITAAFDHILRDRIDILSLSGHKFHAGRGVGVLAKRRRIPSRPFLYGGGQEKGLRSSTENLASIVAFSKALRLARQHYQENFDQIKHFRLQIIQNLCQHGWHVFAQETGSAHIVCAALENIPGEVLLHAFESENIMVSTTSACSSRKQTDHSTLKAMGVRPSLAQSAVRISMSHLTKQSEVDYLCQAIDKISANFQKGVTD